MATKAATKKTPAATTEPTRAPSRSAILATLKKKGYTGPTSFTATVLREVLAWVEAGSPKDSQSVPTGALYAVHPDLKPAPKAKAARLSKWQQGYQEALADIANLGNDLGMIQKWIVDNRSQAVA